ncbi:hypothetical protein JCM19232_1560 [Vibrio ishigakensis]|uniref:BIG2 domain-containing protein n=1 Tax=Vibrio ishigakensis TaxID=1481914 RepID=A0A0B8PIJ3_9VIBR|nr:hypothetical protein JCM19232_1560 [Vibrio ishigakensis]
MTCKAELPREALSITLSPDNATIEIGKTQQYTVMADIPDVGAVDVTQMADVYDPANGETYVSVDNNGLATGIAAGATTLQADYGSQSDTVNVTIASGCNTLADACISVIDRGDGHKFTSSPSRAFLEHHGIAHLAKFWVMEDGTYGPPGEFGAIARSNYAPDLCEHYNKLAIGGRTNWEVTQLYYLEWELWEGISLYDLEGWPTQMMTWAADGSTIDHNWQFHLHYGVKDVAHWDEGHYVTCHSHP